MPLIKRASKRDVISVFENPMSTSSVVYIEGEGYNKSTLAPIFNSAMYMYYGQPATYTIGVNLYRASDQNSYNTRSGDGPQTMVLTKETAYCNQNTLPKGNYRQSNVSYYNKLSMDPNLVASPLRRITDSSNNNLIVWSVKADFYNWYRQITWYNPGQEFHVINPTASWGFDGNGSDGEVAVPVMPTVKETSSNWVSMITQRIRYDGYVARPFWGLGRNNFYAYESGNQTYNTTERDTWYIQYIGQSGVDGKPIYLYNYYFNDYQQYITKHNVSSNNTTDLHYFSAVPTAAGTNYGGARSTASFQTQIRWSSTVFDDPTSAGNKCWYTPYFDSNLNFHPFFYQWNRSTDVFTRSSDITITGDLSSVHLSGLYGNDGEQSRHNGNVEVDTFVNGGNRYLSLIPMHGAYAVYDSLPNARKIITYLVDPANPKNLTHHSVCQVPTTIRNCLFLNDARTVLGIFGTDVFYVYTWTNDAGWTLTSTIAEKFTAVGRDSTDRIWATAVRADGTYADIHVLTAAIPTRITITPALSAYNYTGTVINSTVNVSAYNLNGQRIAVNVSLTITGSTMTFSNDSVAVTVTTSTTGEVSQGIKVVGAGQSDIVATVSI